MDDNIQRIAVNFLVQGIQAEDSTDENPTILKAFPFNGAMNQPGESGCKWLTARWKSSGPSGRNSGPTAPEHGPILANDFGIGVSGN